MVCRFVNDEGKVMERLLGLHHVESCTAAALKEAPVKMLNSHKLPISRIHGQGYDGASNMRGEFNGVQKLIRDENPYAFYVHCFAHQLQLVVVTVECNLARSRDTRWGSHLKTLLRILVMWEAIIDILEIVKKDSVKPENNGEAFGLIGKMESFDFVFIMHLMIELLASLQSVTCFAKEGSRYC
jgi:hypothetical protein